MGAGGGVVSLEGKNSCERERGEGQRVANMNIAQATRIPLSKYITHSLMIFDCGCRKACLPYCGPCVTLILSSTIGWFGYVRLF
jgi:hypothetical protein